MDRLYETGQQSGNVETGPFLFNGERLLLPQDDDPILESIDFKAYGTSDEDLQF